MNYVLDTSALKWAYIDGSKFSQRCRYLISRSRGRVYVAEISVLELTNTLGHSVRSKRMSVNAFVKADLRFLRDVANGKIVVLPLPSSEFIACRQLLTLVGIDAGRNLQTQDAMIAYTARRLALDHHERVMLLTSDQRLSKIIREVSIFRRLVDSEYLDPN